MARMSPIIQENTSIILIQNCNMALSKTFREQDKPDLNLELWVCTSKTMTPGAANPTRPRRCRSISPASCQASHANHFEPLRPQHNSTWLSFLCQETRKRGIRTPYAKALLHRPKSLCQFCHSIAGVEGPCERQSPRDFRHLRR